MSGVRPGAPAAAAPPARWIATGNMANGFLVFGNVVTGVIAVGNVARGFIAIGNVAIGVVAIGNVAIGVVGGFGATIALGAVAASGVLAFPVFDGTAGVASALELHPVLSVFPILFWLLAARLFHGSRAPRLGPSPELSPLRALLRGERSEGWIRARVERADGGALRLKQGGARAELPATPEALGAAGALIPEGREARLYVYVRAEEHVGGGGSGYREAQARERVLTCADLVEPPARVLPWSSGGEAQWWLARAWDAGAVVAIVARGAQIVMGAIG
ncbi:hypothetical protein SOCE26_013500 [Sorangium cellulosum]|uniref:Uncharacterized protein n=1 Tax=Sorangium cellulosum TaxID=56 RepID=A0A2L0EKX8_SORCE|nr:hypothetical protein [Sorangium cellulosum]AUX39955.1 hypothetical protein SOCE26_013500 [Sorangium cellulosum]